MKYLLDTHAFLWAALEPAKLSRKAAEACETGELWLSAASVWRYLSRRRSAGFQCQNRYGISSAGSFGSAGSWSCLYMPATHGRVGEMPLHHRDPFDRMLRRKALKKGCR